jgi:hypothetical protein
VDQVEAKVPEEDFLQEGRRGPLGFAGFFGDLPGFGFGEGTGLFRTSGHRQNSIRLSDILTARDQQVPLLR